MNSGSMKAIYNVLGFLTYWLFGKEEEDESVETVLGLDWLWTRILLEVDLDDWIKLFEGWRGGKFGLSIWKEFDVCIVNEERMFGIFEVMTYEALVFLDKERSWGLIGVSIRMEKDPYPTKTPK